MSCPLCSHDGSRPSWLGSTLYHGREFVYRECLSCRSLYCDPMPGLDTLREMYGPSYQDESQGDAAIEDPKEPQRTLAWLEKLGGGTFIDYGCGAGALLVEARKLGWRAIGVELSDDERAVGVEFLFLSLDAVFLDGRTVRRVGALEDGVLFQFLLNAIGQLHDRELQDLHGLNHAWGQPHFLPLDRLHVHRHADR